MEDNIQVKEEQAQLVVSRAEDIDNQAAMTTMWNLNNALINEINQINKIYSSKHGMFASVPIICKGIDCAYADVCLVSQAQRRLGQRCPMEIGAVVSRYDYWCKHFGIDIIEDAIPDKDLVDASLIRDLVNIEVQMMRAENKVAISGDFMTETLADIDKKCKPYYEMIVSPESQFLLTLQDKKIKILNQLNATRKDKANDKARNTSPSETAIKIFQEMQAAVKSKNIIDIDDIDFDEIETVTDDSIETNEVGTMLEPEEQSEDVSLESLDKE